MTDMNISNAVASDLTTAFTTQADVAVSATYKVPAVQLDSPGEQEETIWTNTKWGIWLGYYKQVPELNSAIDAIAAWSIGKGYIADEATTLILDQVTGWGKDTFNSILASLIRVYHIGGDAYAEIIRDEEGNFINLKSLSPESMQRVVNRKGRIIRYEQLTKVKNSRPLVFQPNEIFHLSRNRLADEMHGEGIIKAVEPIILMRNEAMADWKRVLHRNVEPLWIFHMDTDDTSKINAFKAKMDAARGKGENMYIPLGAVKPELVAAGSNLQPLSWIDLLNGYFWQACGVPDIVVGSSKTLTEASAKIAYLSFQQRIEEEQLYIEENVLNQLNLVIKLQFPARLQSEAISEVSVEEDRKSTRL